MSALIFHIDVNSAFLSWEAARRLRDDPDAQDLRTIDAVIGGSEETRHGVVLAKSPSAKRCGIMTGEPLSHARQKCPHLTVVPPDHELAKYEALTFADINGFNFLLRTELGFWDTLCREKMPASKFLVQPDAMVFEELVNASSLPCFTTDYVRLRDYPNRVNIPLSDEESHVTFYLAKR